MQRARFINARCHGADRRSRLALEARPYDMARLEMDEASFRIGFQDRSIIRSINLSDVRQPDLEPLPKYPQHYPANLVD
jgi:hypothetical protein